MELIFSERYNEIIDAAKKRGWTKKYCKDNHIKAQGHHIKPRCVYQELAKDKNNIVYLTGAEHVEAHYELAENNRWCDALVYAFNTQYQTQAEVSKDGFILAGELLDKAADAIGTNNQKYHSIVLINTGEMFDCSGDASRKYSIRIEHILDCCYGNRNSAGRIGGEKAIWRFEWDIGREVVDDRRIKHNGIILVNTNEYFNTEKEARIKYNSLGKGDILEVCRGKRKTRGKLNGEPMVWRFATEEEIELHKKGGI